MEHISEPLNRVFDKFETLTAVNPTTFAGSTLPFTGVATGFSDLDQITAGLQPSDLIVVSGTTSSGKTSLALGMAYGAAVGHKKTVGIFSLEMSAEQLVQRVLSMETGVDSHRLRLGQIDDNEWDRISRAFGRLSEAPIFVDDSAAGSIMDIRSKSRRLQAEQGLDLIIVDYLQLWPSEMGLNRAEELSSVTRELKALARELGIPIVLVSQLSRAVERRASHRPVLTDLRDSGSIEEDADIVLFIYREEMYFEDTERLAAEIIIAKHRNGSLGSINLRFFDRTARFADLELYPAAGV